MKKYIKELQDLEEVIKDMEEDLRDLLFLVDPEPTIAAYISRLRSILKSLTK